MSGKPALLRRRRVTAVASALLASVALASAAPQLDTNHHTSQAAGANVATPDITRDATTTTVPSTTTAPATTTTSPLTCESTIDLGATEATPLALSTALDARLADRRFGGVTLSASVWVDGFGEVVAHNADVELFPASNQKLLTAYGALALLPHDGTFTTVVRSIGAVRDGELHGDLVIVGGGDPTLTRTGPRSLDTLAAQVRDAGVVRVRGRVLVDESRHEAARMPVGWQDWHVPAYAGPLSALMVDDNRHRDDARYLEQPAIGNAEAFVHALARRGVVVDGTVDVGVAPADAPVIASIESAPFAQLVHDMLLRSDNEIAEMLVREVAVRHRGIGSTALGVALIHDVIERELCVQLEGTSGDGSGMSRANLRSARELRTLVQAMQRSPWWPLLDAALPVAGQTGTLARRFRASAAAGNVRAKTGSIIGGRALTGHLTTAGGRAVVFSIVVNGENAREALGAIDALVATLAADTS